MTRFKYDHFRWSSGGSRLVTGDQNGLLSVWNVTQHGHLINTPIKVVEMNSPISHCLLYSPDYTPDTNSGIMHCHSVMPSC